MEILLLRDEELNSNFIDGGESPKTSMGHFEGLRNLTSRLRPQGCWVDFDGPRKLSFHLRPRGGVKKNVWRKLSSHLRSRGGANLRKALIWDLDEGSVWGVKKIHLSLWDLDGLVPSLSFVLAEIWKGRRQLSAHLRPRGGVESRD